MLIKRSPSEPPENLDQLMVGTCTSCKTLVEIEKWQAQRPTIEKPIGKEPGVWYDLFYTECPTCKSNSPTGSSPRVYLRKKSTQK